VADVDEDGGVI